jgi:hypothetical protein
MRRRRVFSSVDSTVNAKRNSPRGGGDMKPPTPLARLRMGQIAAFQGLKGQVTCREIRASSCASARSFRGPG